MIKELNENNFEENIKSGLKLVEFYATWCGYCQKQRPILKELSENNIWIGTVDSDKNPNLVKKYGVSGYPTFILFKEGKVIAALSGYHEKSQLLSRLMEHLHH
ncbi:MAG: thioredoxin family protein [Candidatus Gastranaerophilaceae bacterium]|nr:thioredoxin [Clostridium sp. CAG:967]